MEVRSPNPVEAPPRTTRPSNPPDRPSALTLTLTTDCPPHALSASSVPALDNGDRLAWREVERRYEAMPPGVFGGLEGRPRRAGYLPGPSVVLTLGFRRAVRRTASK